MRHPFEALKTFRHRRCADLQIRVIGIGDVTAEWVALAVVFINKRGAMMYFGEHEYLRIPRPAWEFWVAASE